MIKKRTMVIMLIILLTVGFASLTTSLIVNSKVDLGLLESDLDVIFKEVLLNKENNDKAFIIEDGKSFIYSADDLVELNQTSEIDYTIMNKSHQYDMEVKVTCITDYEDHLNYTSETIDKSILVEAGEVITGNLISELIKENTSDTSLVLKCTLYYVPVSRDTVVEDKEYIVSFDTGYEEKVEDIKVKYYEVYGSLPELTRSNYAFLGWYTKDDVKVENNSLVKIKDNHTLYAKWEKVCEYDSGQVWTFSYTGAEQTFTVPCDGEYKIELWGAQGGSYNATYYGGFGGYTSGIILLRQPLNLLLNIGGTGVSGALVTSSNYLKSGGYNGGGYGSYGYYCSGGGGSSDVRIGLFTVFDRIMVAAGGGGSGSYRTHLVTAGGRGGSAGGINGYDGTNDLNDKIHYVGKGATQILGGLGNGENHYGSFFYGANSPVPRDDRSGGGGGYYGGGASYENTGAGGGSSFISGHNGCDAIAESSTSSNIIHTGQPNHYSGYVFTNTVMIDGDGYKWSNVKGSYTGMPTHDGKSTMTGNSGNGYAKITFLG